MFVKPLKSSLKYFSILLLSGLMIQGIVMSIDGLYDRGQYADIGLVLGNRIEENGNLSLRLHARVEHAKILYNSGRIKKIFVSGGYGKEGYLEGEKMADYLQKQGVKVSDIIIDNSGNSTELSVQNIINYSQENSHLTSVMVVSQYFHISRTKMLLKKMGYNGDIASSSPWYFELRDAYSIPRECFAFWVQYFS